MLRAKHLWRLHIGNPEYWSLWLAVSTCTESSRFEMIKVIDNFLSNDEFVKIRNVICDDDFPFFYNEFITDEDDPSDYFYFTHLFFIKNAPNSRYFYLWESFLQKIECKGLIRIKANLYTKTKKRVIHRTHTDYDYDHKGCLFYINDNNGATYFKDKQILSKANRAVFFKPNQPHSSSSCTDQNRRITINFNYF
jgi:hypothetical protein